MIILEIRIKIEPDKTITLSEIENLGDYIKDTILDLEDSLITDVTYEVRDDFQE